MKKLLLSFALACAAALSAAGQPVDAEVVFVLDTTGSMSGLIEGAKQKIWSIATNIVQTCGGKVRIGLVPYRDRNDAYVTRVYPLSGDLDSVFCNLRTFTAAGGGDSPESVNQALFEAVGKIAWSPASKPVLKAIFLVGDCPPHMDYQDDVKFDVTCKIAAAQGIAIHTVQCGSQPETEPFWRAIAASANGSYSRIGQTGNMQLVPTPYDADIARITIELGSTALPYGKREEQVAYARRLKTLTAPGVKPGVVAERNAYNFAAAKAVADESRDLTVKPELLASLKPEELPTSLRPLSPEERRTVLTRNRARQDEFNARLSELNRKRAAFLRARPASNEKSFDAEIQKSIEKQLHSVRSGATVK